MVIADEAGILGPMNNAASPGRPDPQNRLAARDSREAPVPSSWLRLGLAGALGFVSGAMLFATPAEGASRDPARPVRRAPARANPARRSR